MEIRAIQNALKSGKGGLIVLPLKGGIRYTPHLVPSVRKSGVDSKAVESLTLNLKTIGCDRAFVIPATGRVTEIRFK